MFSCRCNSTYRLRYWNSYQTLIHSGLTLNKLQQYLPLAVLKLKRFISINIAFLSVATVLTACGIETVANKSLIETYLLVATVLTACGIETERMHTATTPSSVATVLTACGIETAQFDLPCRAELEDGCNSTYRLRYWNASSQSIGLVNTSCNSTYRLRYWNILDIHELQLLNLKNVATVLTACGIETSWSLST